MDEQATRSCSVPVSMVGDKKITTIEGLDKEAKHPLQEPWREHDVPQCGYCQAGQLMSAAALLSDNKAPSDAEIDEHMYGNLCRCASYTRIKAAVKTAAKKL